MAMVSERDRLRNVFSSDCSHSLAEDDSSSLAGDDSPSLVEDGLGAFPDWVSATSESISDAEAWPTSPSSWD